MQDHLAGLNDKQREAALHMDGPLLIVAGAGAGKTRVIVHRILNLIKNGVEPGQILAVTFTNKAAKEMRERVQNLLQKEPGLAPGQGYTFLKEWVSPALGGANNRATEKKHIPVPVLSEFPTISTFHSLGVRIIKENARVLGLKRHFTILDEDDSLKLVKESIVEAGLDPKQYDPKRFRGIISREKGELVSQGEYAERAENFLSRTVGRVWEIYENKKRKEGSLDFDDLLVRTAELIKENSDVKRIYQDRWRYMHIDEYQDTNRAQYLLSRLLSENHRNICAVGDADQNIYSWRGANLKNILSFEKDYPDAKVVLLEENYRSAGNILTAANEVIKKNKYRPEKNLFTQQAAGEKIGLYEAISEVDEAEFVAGKILRMMDTEGGTREFASGLVEATPKEKQSAADPRTRANSAGLADMTTPLKKQVSGLAFSETAILYRANFQSRVLEEAMIRYNIPYQVLGVKFFERKEVKDVLSYLRAALNPDSLSDIKRIINFPARGIGKVTLAKMFSGWTEDLPEKTRVKIKNFYGLLEEIREKIFSERTSEAVRFAVLRSGIETELKNGSSEDLERLENIKELATLAIKYDALPPGEGAEKLLEDAALASDQDSLITITAEEKKEKRDSVKLMTVHAAKGLEFDYVFVTGLEDGLFPAHGDGSPPTGWKNAEDREEERRLFYVALTRARKKVFLSFADTRTIFGSRQINAPSEFIFDIPDKLLERETIRGHLKTIYV